MSRLVVPLGSRILHSTGDVVLHAKLELLLKDVQGVWRLATFRVDSGTEMTSMPAADARNLDLPLPRQANSLLTHGPTGQEVRSGFLRAQVLGMDGTEYAFPCYFLGDPYALVIPSGGRAPLNLLGLTGVVDKLRLIFDGSVTAGAPFGNLSVEKI